MNLAAEVFLFLAMSGDVSAVRVVSVDCGRAQQTGYNQFIDILIARLSLYFTPIISKISCAVRGISSQNSNTFRCLAVKRTGLLFCPAPLLFELTPLLFLSAPLLFS